MSLKLSAIYIYPVKSLPGIQVSNAFAEDRGLRGDRRWMLTDQEGRFISLREEHGMLNFRITSEEQGWRITYGDSGISIPRDWTEGKRVSVRIWDDEVTAMEGKTVWSQWFSEKLERECRLVHMGHDARRMISDRWRLGDEEVSFADGYPYLIVNQESLDKLSETTGMLMDVRRFRPNLVLSGGGPFGELRYRRIRIGDAIFNGLKPCERCVVTTLDPETGAQGKEPLRSLAAMKVDGKVVFGQHASLHTAGRFSAGQPVEIPEIKDYPYDPL